MKRFMRFGFCFLMFVFSMDVRAESFSLRLDQLNFEFPEAFTTETLGKDKYSPTAVHARVHDQLYVIKNGLHRKKLGVKERQLYLKTVEDLLKKQAAIQIDSVERVKLDSLPALKINYKKPQGQTTEFGVAWFITTSSSWYTLSVSKSGEALTKDQVNDFFSRVV